MAGSILPLATPSSLPPEQQQKTMQAAQNFEAMALGQLLTPIFDSVDTANGLFGGGEAESTWKPMLVNEMAKSIAQNGGLGIARPVYEEMLRLQEGRAGGKR